jgi:pyruvate ferredoxin oxidoreductase beta subunit
MSSQAVNARNLTNEEFFYGHKACAGCGGSVAVRLALKVLGPKTYTVIPANCMSSVGMLFPQMSYMGNAIISPFAATGAMLSGVAAGARATGVEDFNVVGFAGDGGTADIGLQALSGAIDRHDKVIYICYDNEAYMNTGVQQSGLTPYGAKTTTSPVGENIPGAIKSKKNMFEIVAAHDIEYAATASVGYPQDFLNKMQKAKQVKGTSYIHVMAPCPTGWEMPTEETIAAAKEAVDCGLWYLAEFENSKFTLNKNPKGFTSVKKYLLGQGRFRHPRVY